MRCSKGLLGVAALALMFVAVAPLWAQEAKPEGKTNVELIFKLGRIEDGQKTQYKSYRLVAADGARESELLAGRRVPLPGGEGSIVYQNVGFLSRAMVRMIDKKTVHVVVDIEDSQIVKGEAGMPPSVETRQLAVSAVLKEGVPLELTRVNGVEDISGYVELEVRILD